MKKFLLLTFVILLNVNVHAIQKNPSEQQLSNDQAWQMINDSPDQAFVKVLPPNLLNDATYVELAKEGWTIGEIIRLTDEYLAANKPEMKKAGANIHYAKKWRPYYVSSLLLNSTIAEYTDPKSIEKAMSNVEETQVDPHAYFPRLFYNVNDRLSKVRNTGYFRHNACMPAGGRIHWMAVHPENPDRIMIIPDSEGIWRTDDMGKHWDCITDRIPNRYDRNHSDAYSIPVDPDNWDHIFAFMNNSTVYETTDAGQTWRKIAGATHKGFKRGYCFRDADGKLKFIGAKPISNNGLNAQLWISSDTCKTWTSIVATSEQKDITVNNSAGVPTKSFWFQEMAFHPTNRNVLYAAGSRRILRSTDGGSSWSSMKFKVYGSSTAVVRTDSTDIFPLATADAPMFLSINPTNGNEMWAALSTRANAGHSALYKTTDGGASWITLQEPSAGFGSGGIFGNESAWNWLGGFAVNFADPRYVYGCSMSSAESTNSGVTFVEKSWTDRSNGIYPSGSVYNVSVASHNADNHVLKAHKSGRIYRGGDAGLIIKDPTVNGGKWTNITGDMGEMMFYTSTTNEFGDFAIAGNTQDINIQTYRGGRWGASRGYEGSTIWMNPFSGEEHFPYLTAGGTSIQNQDYGSWSRAWTKADVCTGNWYIRREGTNPDGSRFSVVKNFGKSSIAIDNSSTGWVQDFALSRDNPVSKLFIVRNNKLYYSVNNGSTFVLINTGTFAPTKVAVNPDNSNEIYIAKDGAVSMTTNGGISWQNISTAALNSVPVRSFYYHEGSGDLYFVSSVHGIFLREAGTSSWVLWSKGYNTAKLADAQINYTTQEMIITDYGSGIWIADLENPADRFLKNGFALKQLSNIDSTRTFGIDIHYTIPLYYYFKWFVNGVEQIGENGQYFTSSSLMPNDKVKLEVTVRESPDVITQSAEFTVTEATPSKAINKRGNYLYSNQKGRVDLGYVDHFFGNFTLQMWVNPKSDGVILANRQANTNSVKGFVVAVNGGKFNFTYTPETNFEQPYDEAAKTKHFSLDGGTAELNTWQQITITHNRTGNIQFYVNGVLKASQARALPAFTLNNSLYLSLFADGYQMNPIDGSVDELKIWNNVMDLASVRKSMYALPNIPDAKLIYYNDFNAATLPAQKERFSQTGMYPKMDAVVSVNESALGVCASDFDYKSALATTWLPFAKKGVTAMEIKSNLATFAPNVMGTFYDDSFLGVKSNLPEAYYNVYPTSFGVKMFDVTDFTKTVDVKLYLDPALADGYAQAKIYTQNMNAHAESWTSLATSPVYNATEKSLTLTGIKASDVNNKQIAVVIPKPAIELTSATFTNGNELYIYTPDTVKVPFQATLVGGMSSPVNNYGLVANSSVVKQIDSLMFINNVAQGSASIVLEDNNQMNARTNITITGQDISLKPFEFSAINKMTARTIQKGIRLNKGGVVVGSGANFAAMNAKNTATYMTWVKLEDATMLTGYKMLMFFRGTGSKATGLALYNGKLCCHWNDESWSWEDVNTVNSGLSLTASDIGKWVHVAMTASPTGLEFYLNGKKGNKVTRTINPATIGSALTLGKNQSGDVNFIGSFDQVSLWNKTLTQQEIVKYMHSRTLLNETGIVSYITFDNEDTGGGYTDLKSNAVVNFDGVVVKNLLSVIPFNFEAQQLRTKSVNDGKVLDSVAFTLPVSYPGTYTYFTTRFTGNPYNAIDTKYPKQVSLEGAYRTISLAYLKTFTSSEKVVLAVNNQLIAQGDSVIVYARTLGSEAAFTNRYSVMGQAGKAVFELPATLFNESLLYMFYRLLQAPNATEAPNEYKYKLTVDNGNCTILNLRGNAHVTFYDLHGRVVVDRQTSDFKSSFEMSDGVYVVKIEEMGEACMTKLVVAGNH